MRITTTAVVLATLALAACSMGSDLEFLPSTLDAPFILQSVNGAALPAVVVDSAIPSLRLDAVSGVITIKPNNIFTFVTTFRQTQGNLVSTQTVSCAGTYTAVGLVFQFVEAALPPNCGITFSGVVSGTALNTTVLGVPAVFSQ
jgi:hypothetical protein